MMCILCHEREPVGRSLLDGGCFARMRGDLATAVWAHAWLETTALTPPGVWKPGTRHRAGGSQPPLNVALIDACVDIHGKLGSWARMIAEEHVPALHGPAADTVPAIGVWLRERLPWVSDQPWCDEFAGELSVLRRTAYGLAPWDRSRSDMPLPCPSCGLLSLSLYSGDEAITCRTRLCGRVLALPEYHGEVAAWWERANSRREVMAA